MALTTDQIVAAEGAKRLLSDPIFNDTINELIADATQKAIIADAKQDREAHRQLVLALGRVRGALEAAIDYVESEKESAQRAKAFE
jgi:hypothetical protein